MCLKRFTKLSVCFLKKENSFEMSIFQNFFCFMTSDEKALMWALNSFQNIFVLFDQNIHKNIDLSNKLFSEHFCFEEVVRGCARLAYRRQRTQEARPLRSRLQIHRVSQHFSTFFVTYKLSYIN